MNEDLALLVKDRNASEDSICALLECKADAVKLEFFEIGYLLNLLYDKLWCFDNKFRSFDNFYDWAEQVLGFKHTTVKNLMKLNRVYCDKSKDTRCLYVGACFNAVEYSPHMDEKWLGFSQTALVEMLPLSEFDRGLVEKDMSISSIRELKKQLAGGGQSTDQEKISAGDGQSTDQEQISVGNSQLTDQIDEVVIENAVSKCEHITIQAEDVLKHSNRLILKNVKERKAWLDAYKDNCYLWLELPMLSANIYRYDFCNGVYLLVTEFLEADSIYGSLAYQLIGGDCFSSWVYYSYTFNRVIEYLTTYRDEV